MYNLHSWSILHLTKTQQGVNISKLKVKSFNWTNCYNLTKTNNLSILLGKTINKSQTSYFFFHPTMGTK